MFPANKDLPTPLTSLDDMIDEGTDQKPYKVFIGHNLGNRSFCISIPMHEFFGMSEVANELGDNGEPIAQRKLNLPHARKLAAYILKGLVSAAIERREMKDAVVVEEFLDIQHKLGKQPYLALQPVVCNIRTCHPGGASLAGYRMKTTEDETACFKIMLAQKDILWVIDGQHRRYAMYLVFEFLEQIRKNQLYPRKSTLYPEAHSEELTAAELAVWQECYEAARSFCTIMCEIHLGLVPEQERQLFHDMNNLGKKVEASMALQFDNSNPINIYIKEVLIDDILGWDVLEKDTAQWKDDTGAIIRKDLVAINAILFLNKTNISGATPPVVDPKLSIVSRFWDTIKQIPNLGEEKAKINTVAAQPVVLKAISKLVYDFAFSKRKIPDAAVCLEKVFDHITSVDFSHSNPMWRYYQFSEEERIEHGLETLAHYLPSDDEGYNRDIGGFDKVSGVMRFGTRHNDIYPIIGDMIRWSLDLPGRHNRELLEK